MSSTASGFTFPSLFKPSLTRPFTVLKSNDDDDNDSNTLATGIWTAFPKPVRSSLGANNNIRIPEFCGVCSRTPHQAEKPNWDKKELKIKGKKGVFAVWFRLHQPTGQVVLSAFFFFFFSPPFFSLCFGRFSFFFFFFFFCIKIGFKILVGAWVAKWKVRGTCLTSILRVWCGLHPYIIHSLSPSSSLSSSSFLLLLLLLLLLLFFWDAQYTDPWLKIVTNRDLDRLQRQPQR